MSLDFPAMGQELWALSDATGLRPEYLLPVLWHESGFNPAIVNGIGCTGINQLCQNIPAGYASLSASQQMAAVVSPMFRGLAARYGALRSGVRVYQANLLPATLPVVKTLPGVLARRGVAAPVPGAKSPSQAAVYTSNSGLDADRSGTITLADLAAVVKADAARGQVKTAIAETYALRPSEQPRDPVYGDDFPSGGGLLFGWSAGEWVLAVAAVAGVSAAAYVASRR